MSKRSRSSKSRTGKTSPPRAEPCSPPSLPSASGTDQAGAEQDQLARQALELRLAGCGYPEICQLLGLESNWQVWRLLQRAFKLAPREGLVLLHRLELWRLDRLIRSLWRQAVRGELPVLDRLLKLLAQRARLLRDWRRHETHVRLPTLTLQQALAADRQLESWLQQHQPASSPAPPDKA